MARRYYFEKEISHQGLNKTRVLKATSQSELQQKILEVETQWNELWVKKCAAEKKRNEREKTKENHEKSANLAEKQTNEAEKIQDKMDTFLVDSLKFKKFKWDKLKDKSDYAVPKPELPIYTDIPEQPLQSNIKYNQSAPALSLFSKRLKEEHENKMSKLYSFDLNIWQEKKDVIDIENKKKSNNHKESLRKWEEEKAHYTEKLAEKNLILDRKNTVYETGIDTEYYEFTDVINEVYERIICSCSYPFEFNQQVESEYYKDNKLFLIDVYLPVIEELPRLKKVVYSKTKNEFTEQFHTEAYLNKKYDNVIYQMVLQLLNIVFTQDQDYNYIDAVVINGKVSTIDRATGKSIEPYILSLQISKSSFAELNLAAIDPKAWFKSAKGVSAPKLTNMTPVAPVLIMNKEDSRFVDEYGVAESVDETTNLAAMDWQDFENLIREIFEKEFSTNGGEVKITQASRDGGVDAIAFDPDPIRGGKIVIQAKRYTNVVGVSAVRDLYGTTMNEGATKGILVTTSNYGSDAYNFANGKPITLLNGANLLSLLERHGHRARIDINEAKKVLNNN